MEEHSQHTYAMHAILLVRHHNHHNRNRNTNRNHNHDNTFTGVEEHCQHTGHRSCQGENSLPPQPPFCNLGQVILCSTKFDLILIRFM